LAVVLVLLAVVLVLVLLAVLVVLVVAGDRTLL
jgi:hypothetical protein